jgi:hypothetical protein
VPLEKTKYTSREFWDFVNLPENADRFFERIEGEIVEYMPANPYSSEVAVKIVVELGIFLKGKDLLTRR